MLAPYAARYRGLGPLISVAGRISTGDAAERVLSSGAADLVQVGRATHADPEWPNKVLAGQPPRPCIACNQGCIDQVHNNVPIWCAVNPDTGQEAPAAAAAARPAAPGAGARRRSRGPGGGAHGGRAGHEVTLVEAGERIGGRTAPPRRCPAVRSSADCWTGTRTSWSG